MSDAVYKAMLAEPRVARDLIVGFVAPWCGDGWLDGVDLDSLAPAPTEIVADDRRRRLVDVAWSARLRGAGGPDEPSSVHFVVEHQSTVDHGMALRFEEYRGLLRQRIVRRLLGDGRRLRRGEKVDAVLCVLVYDGAVPWDAPADFAELEAGAPRGFAGNRYLAIDLRRDPVEHLPESNAVRRLAELARGGPRGWPRLARRLGEWLDREADAGLRRAFGLWLDEVNKRLGADLSFESAEEAGTMIAERLAEFEAEIRAESEKKGRVEGRVEGRAAGRAEGRAAGRAEGRAAGRAEGRAAGRAEGREAGRAEGREAGFGEGIALEKAHLCRMAGRRVGASAGESLAVALADVSDPDRLARAGDCIVDSGSAGEFVAGVRAAIGDADPPDAATA